jgi:hypothetical protein
MHGSLQSHSSKGSSFPRPSDAMNSFFRKFIVEGWPEMGAGGSQKVLNYFLYCTIALYIKPQSFEPSEA